MKKHFSLFLSVLYIWQTLLLCPVQTEAVSTKYSLPAITGEESRTESSLYDGVTRTDIVLSQSSPYKKQAFTVVEFDPAQDDLYFEVRGGDATYLTKKNLTSDTLARFNSEGSGKRALVATNGGLWMSINYQVRAEGSEGSYVYPEYPANVKKGYNIPWGYNMYGGEIVCTNNIEEETPFPGHFRQFGITHDGEPLFGCVVTHTTITNAVTGKSVKSEGINRLPADNALITYTDRGMASNYCLDDAYEVVIDFDYDYTVRPGCILEGTVTEISPPGSTRAAMTANRIILTARGDRLADLESYSVGHKVFINVEVEDSVNPQNSSKWYSVDNCVNGHQCCIWDGVPQGIETTTYYPATILGLKSDGNVVMITSYGRQYNSTGDYYSYGLQIAQVDELCMELGIETCFLMDGGGSATMWCEVPDGSYELTGRPCDKHSDGTYGAERRVLSSLFLAVGPSRSGIDSTDVVPNADIDQKLIRESDGVSVFGGTDYITLTASKVSAPDFKYDLFNASADNYKYMVIEACPTDHGGGTFTLGLTPASGQNLFPASNTERKLSFLCDGTWQRQLLDLSSSTGWSGRMSFIQMRLFADSGVAPLGSGINLSRVKFFDSYSAAANFASGNTDPPLFGDADGSGSVNLADVTTILKWISGFPGSVTEDGDYDRNGSVELADAVLLLRAVSKK